ncbi:hypothetical protein BN946_scf184779.g7 [Trametes cinnabarina]|uniref:Uncharacterized protein n=1 Tax=Pycnoporus cinnabarinus TaxID=5643 RepID=A0A060SE68_PYCCI|nr:hypothetical protein BN946_scf184779.g7 [Trametes cinnabarina]
MVPDFGTPGVEVACTPHTKEQDETTSQCNEGTFALLGDYHSDSDGSQVNADSQQALQPTAIAHVSDDDSNAQTRKHQYIQKPSRSQQKAHRQKAIRADLDAHRQVPDSANTHAKRSPSGAVAQAKVSAKTPEKTDVFSIGWCRQLQVRAQAARSLRTVSSPVLLTPKSTSKPPRTKAAAKALYKENLASQTNGYNSDIGGFTDGDVFANRHRVMSHKKKGKAKLHPELEFVEISSDSAEQAPGLSSSYKKTMAHKKETK